MPYLSFDFKVNTSVKEIPGDPAADPSHPPGCHSRHDEVVEDDEDEHGGDDGGGERVNQLVVQLQVQVQVDGQAKGSDGEDLHTGLLYNTVFCNIKYKTGWQRELKSFKTDPG